MILTPFTGCQTLANWIQRRNQQASQIPSLDLLILQLEIAPLPAGLAADARAVRWIVFADGKVSMVTKGNQSVGSPLPALPSAPHYGILVPSSKPEAPRAAGPERRPGSRSRPGYQHRRIAARQGLTPWRVFCWADRHTQRART